MSFYDVTINKGLGNIARFVTAVEEAPAGEAPAAYQEGTLARTLQPNNKSYEIDVVSKYRWTLSNVINEQAEEIPYIRLKEFKCLESSIEKQISFYTQYSADVAANVANVGSSIKKGVLDDYKSLWPKTNPTGFTYKIPYFNKTGQELGTEPWQALDAIGDSLKDVAGGVGKFLSKNAQERISQGMVAAELVGSAANTAMNYKYPSVGVVDRPKMFSSHSDRNINVSCTLYNTVLEKDWKDNKNLIYLLMSQNLFNKRDFTTGIPPVFYEVYIPGQYYSFASCMTNFKVEHLGNQRLLKENQDNEFIVPDAYQIDFTLTELVKPSKNQYEALITGEARDNVTIVQ